MSIEPAAAEFAREVVERVERNRHDPALEEAARGFMLASTGPKYSYNFSWLGRPIIQYPQDIVAMQELIWRVQPDVIVETGIAHGGSLVLSASLLELNAICGGSADAFVLGVDVDIRKHNRAAIESHPMSRRIRMLEGSSTDPTVVSSVRDIVSGRQRVLVCLDSNHTHQHVLAELQAYAPLVSVGSYCVVFDTVIDELPAGSHPGRTWGPGDNPKTAVREYLRSHAEFEVDHAIDGQLLISVAREGYLRRVS